MPEEEPGLSEVLHQLDLLRRDTARVELRLGELVSLDRYQIEHSVQERDHARLEVRVSDLEKARANMMNMILSSFVFPLVIAIVVYVITTGA